MIKFRAWDKVNKCWNDDIVISDDGIPLEMTGFVGVDLKVEQAYDIEIMQSTGLKDKNGVEIFEGDVLINDLGRICHMRWHEYQVGFDAEFIRDTNYQEGLDMTVGFRSVHLHIFSKVIGNIHENPELLEQS